LVEAATLGVELVRLVLRKNLVWLRTESGLQEKRQLLID